MGIYKHVAFETHEPKHDLKTYKVNNLIDFIILMES